MDGIRTTNWKRMNMFIKTKPMKEEKHCRKAEIVKKILRRYTNEFKRENFMFASGGRKWGKSTAHRLHLMTHRFSLGQLMHALATNNRKAIKMAIDKRINIRGKL